MADFNDLADSHPQDFTSLDGWAEATARAGMTHVHRQMKGIEVSDSLGFHFRGERNATIVFEETAFKDVTVAYEGVETTFVFDSCSWENSTLIFEGVDNTFILESCGFTNSSIVGDDGDYMLESMASDDLVVTTEAGSFSFSQAKTVNLNVIPDDPRVETVDDTVNDVKHRVYHVNEAEELEFLGCKFNGSSPSSVNQEAQAGGDAGREA